MILFKRKPIVLDKPGFRVQWHHIVAAVSGSVLLGWSLAFFIINPCEATNFTDEYCEIIQPNADRR